jgi:hypothetical protein
MSRNKGTFNFSANFEVLAKAPLDARLVVDRKENLITPSIWQDASNNVWLYKGIVVSVVSDPSTQNNGLYFLLDETQYTDYNFWLKIQTGNIVGVQKYSNTFDGSIGASLLISSETHLLGNGPFNITVYDGIEQVYTGVDCDASGNITLIWTEGTLSSSCKYIISG